MSCPTPMVVDEKKIERLTVNPDLVKYAFCGLYEFKRFYDLSNESDIERLLQFEKDRRAEDKLIEEFVFIQKPCYDQHLALVAKPQMSCDELGSGHLALIAKKDFEANEVITVYQGERLRCADHPERVFSHFSFALGNDEFIDCTHQGTAARYSNQTLAPNAEYVLEEREIRLKAKRAIKAGEEISVHYGELRQVLDIPATNLTEILEGLAEHLPVEKKEAITNRIIEDHSLDINTKTHLTYLFTNRSQKRTRNGAISHEAFRRTLALDAPESQEDEEMKPAASVMAAEPRVSLKRKRSDETLSFGTTYEYDSTHWSLAKRARSRAVQTPDPNGDIEMHPAPPPTPELKPAPARISTPMRLDAEVLLRGQKLHQDAMMWKDLSSPNNIKIRCPFLSERDVSRVKSLCESNFNRAMTLLREWRATYQCVPATAPYHDQIVKAQLRVLVLSLECHDARVAAPTESSQMRSPQAGVATSTSTTQAQQPALSFQQQASNILEAIFKKLRAELAMRMQCNSQFKPNGHDFNSLLCDLLERYIRESRQSADLRLIIELQALLTNLYKNRFTNTLQQCHEIRALCLAKEKAHEQVQKTLANCRFKIFEQSVDIEKQQNHIKSLEYTIKTEREKSQYFRQHATMFVVPPLEQQTQEGGQVLNFEFGQNGQMGSSPECIDHIHR